MDNTLIIVTIKIDCFHKHNRPPCLFVLPYYRFKFYPGRWCDLKPTVVLLIESSKISGQYRQLESDRFLSLSSRILTLFWDTERRVN